MNLIEHTVVLMRCALAAETIARKSGDPEVQRLAHVLQAAAGLDLNDLDPEGQAEAERKFNEVRRKEIGELERMFLSSPKKNGPL